MHTKTGQFQFFTAEERKLLSKGIDMANYQYPLDKDPNNVSVNGVMGYDVFKANKLDFVIMKAGSQHTADEGYTTDTQFTASNVAEFRKRGLKVGTYYYARYINVKTLTAIYTGGYADANLIAEATKEADNYATILESVFGAGKCGDIIPVLDFEDNRLDTPYVMTPHQAFVWMKAFKDQMVVRFPQLASRGGVMLYTAYYFIGDGCGGDVKKSDGTYISTEIPKLWWSANSSDSGYHSAGQTSYDTYDYNMTTFGGYTKWVMWQYSTDRNRHGKEYLANTSPIDLDVVDTINYTFNDILVYPETKPQNKKLLDGKADKIHTHIGEYLPLKNGTLEGATKVIHPDAFMLKQENNVSWKVGRLSTSITSSHLAPEIAFIPSSDYYAPFSSVEAETWDTTKAIVFKPDGSITCAGNIVLTNANFGTTAGTVAQGNHTHSGFYEPVIATKNTAFNLNLGTTAGTVSEGNHVHANDHTHSNKTQLDLVPSTLGTNGQVLTSNGSGMAWATPSGTSFDPSAGQDITGLYTFWNGQINYGIKLNSAINGADIVRYVHLARVWQASGSSWQRNFFDCSTVITGNTFVIGQFQGLVYSQANNTTYAGTMCEAYSKDRYPWSGIGASAVTAVKSTGGDGSAIVDFYIQLPLNGNAYVVPQMVFADTNCAITFNVSKTKLDALPTVSSTFSFGGQTYTVQSNNTVTTIKTFTTT